MEADDAELIRQWRNDPKISKFMFYKGEITPAMQSEWFTSIDNEQNFFFLIYHNNSPAGLINISSIDWENKTAYTGLFIYDDKFLASDIPVMASLAMLDVFFLLFLFLYSFFDFLVSTHVRTRHCIAKIMQSI